MSTPRKLIKGTLMIAACSATLSVTACSTSNSHDHMAEELVARGFTNPVKDENDLSTTTYRADLGRCHLRFTRDDLGVVAAHMGGLEVSDPTDAALMEIEIFRSCALGVVIY